MTTRIWSDRSDIGNVDKFCYVGSCEKGVNVWTGKAVQQHLVKWRRSGETTIVAWRLNEPIILSTLLYNVVLGGTRIKERPGRSRTNWRSVVNKDLQRMSLRWEESEVGQLLTDMDGVFMASECGPMCPVGCGLNFKSRSRLSPWYALSSAHGCISASITYQSLMV